MIVTATGLTAKLLAGMQIVVDGELIDLSKKFVYKGMMYSDVPERPLPAFGYTNASLDAEMRSDRAIRLPGC